MKGKCLPAGAEFGESNNPPIKAPNTKHQTPKKLQVPSSSQQTPSSKHQRSSKFEARAAVWSLEVGIYLVFGAWFLVFRFRDFFGAWRFEFGVSFSHLSLSA